MRAFVVLGWILAVAATGAASYLYLDMQALRAEIAAAGPASPTPEPLATPDDLTKLQETVAMLEAKLARYEEQADAPEEVAEAAAPQIDPAALLQGMLAQTGDEAKPEAKGMLGAVSKMFEGERGERMLASVAKSQVGMMYGDFIEGLGLDDAGKQAVRDIITDHIASAASMGLKAASENDFEALASQKEAADNALRDELAQVLSPTELAQFDTYQETLGPRMMAQGIEMQMQYMAPEVTAENRELLASMAYEAALASPAMAPGNPAATNPAEAMQEQAAIYDRMLQQAAEVMEPAQYAAAETFLRQQQEMMESIAESFGPEESPGE
jgi:hypothetical protein